MSRTSNEEPAFRGLFTRATFSLLGSRDEVLYEETYVVGNNGQLVKEAVERTAPGYDHLIGQPRKEGEMAAVERTAPSGYDHLIGQPPKEGEMEAVARTAPSEYDGQGEVEQL